MAVFGDQPPKQHSFERRKENKRLEQKFRKGVVGL